MRTDISRSAWSDRSFRHVAHAPSGTSMDATTVVVCVGARFNSLQSDPLAMLLGCEAAIKHGFTSPPTWYR
jgi:hypothetical protein